MHMSKKELVEKLERDIDGLKEGLKDFLDKVRADLNDGADPGLAAFHLEAADALLENAARLQVLEQVHGALTKPDSKATIMTLTDHARREALNGARFPRRSSSQACNLLYAYRVAAWADLIDPISGLLHVGLEE
jgi:hypothetical protein